MHRCIGPGHSKLASATAAMKKQIALLRATRGPISYVSGRKKGERRGFTNNSPHIPISGCLL